MPNPTVAAGYPKALLDFAGNANVQNAALKDFVADTKAAAEKQLKMAQDLPDN